MSAKFKVGDRVTIMTIYDPVTKEQFDALEWRGVRCRVVTVHPGTDGVELKTEPGQVRGDFSIYGTNDGIFHWSADGIVHTPPDDLTDRAAVEEWLTR